jgi:eukaryotic-like serine/threonine-protein kinase
VRLAAPAGKLWLTVGYHLFQQRGTASADHDDFAATVASMPPGLAAASAQPASAPAAPVSDGETGPEISIEHQPTLAHIGRYALKGSLGIGGLGQVHEAWDPLLSRCVAVKTLHFDVPQGQRVALDGLFLNEARAAAGLSHPHIVTIHDAGLSPNGVYIAMERLYGRDLRQALSAGWQPTAAQAAQLVRRVAEALAYAHARGVVHCDIKPGNIFLCKRDKPKVLDFGIARVAHGGVARDLLKALDGMVAGSPHYLAPEQLRGGTVDARTDIHALGVVFYELLAGRRAFAGDSVEQISNAVLNNHPAPAHEVRPGVPVLLSLVAAKAMAQDPALRYGNALTMAMELRQWAEHELSGNEPAAPATAAEPLDAAPRPRRRAWAGAAALLLGVGAAAVLALRPAQPEAEPLPAPPAPTPWIESPPVSQVPTVPTAPPPAAVLVAEPVIAAEPAVAVQAANPPPAPSKPAATPRPSKPAAAVVSRPAPAPVAAAPLSGTLQLAITPWGEVEVNGQPMGTTPPLTTLTLPAGSHQITVRNGDLPPHTLTVRVQADTPVTVRHRF